MFNFSEEEQVTFSDTVKNLMVVKHFMQLQETFYKFFLFLLNGFFLLGFKVSLLILKMPRAKAIVGLGI